MNDGTGTGTRVGSHRDTWPKGRQALAVGWASAGLSACTWLTVLFCGCESGSPSSDQQIAALKREVASLRELVERQQVASVTQAGGIDSGSIAPAKTGVSQEEIAGLRFDLRVLAARLDSTVELVSASIPRTEIAGIVRQAVQRSWGKGAGATPDHQWRGTSLRLRRADGSWGDFVDLSPAVSGDSGGSTTSVAAGLGSARVFSLGPESSTGMSARAQDGAGLVVATIHAGRNGRGVISGGTGQVRVKASVHWKDFGGNQNLFITDDSFVLPVREGAGWEVSSSQWEGSVEAAVYWIPLE